MHTHSPCVSGAAQDPGILREAMRFLTSNALRLKMALLFKSNRCHTLTSRLGHHQDAERDSSQT